MPRPADADPANLPHVLTMRDALAVGMTPDEVRQRVRSGRWQRVSRGVYDRRTSAATAASPDLDRDRRTPPDEPSLERARLLAVARRRPGAVVSHDSAAVLHGLPTLRRSMTLHLTVAPGGNAQRAPGIVVHRTSVEAADVVSIDGSSVTSPLRTWLDLARSGGLAAGLAAGDSGIRSRLLTKAEAIERAAALPRGARGRVTAIEAARSLDGRRESPLESWSWARFVEWRLPLPRMQAELVDDTGDWLAFADFLWDGLAVVGECDGSMKYRTSDDLVREKRREDRIREAGYRVVRWGWADVARGRELRWRLERLLR